MGQSLRVLHRIAPVVAVPLIRQYLEMYAGKLKISRHFLLSHSAGTYLHCGIQ